MKIIKDTKNSNIHSLHIELDVSEVPSRELILDNLTTSSQMEKGMSNWSLEDVSDIQYELVDYLFWNDTNLKYNEIPDGCTPTMIVVYPDETYRELTEFLLEEVFIPMDRVLPIDPDTGYQVVGVDMVPSDERVLEVNKHIIDTRQGSINEWLSMYLNGTLEEEGYETCPVPDVTKVMVSEGPGCILVPLEVYIDYILNS